MQNPEALVTEYFLPLDFGFLIMPENAAFAHTVELQASLHDVGEMISVFIIEFLTNDLSSI